MPKGLGGRGVRDEAEEGARGPARREELLSHGRTSALFVAQKEATEGFSLWLLDGEWPSSSKNGNRERSREAPVGIQGERDITCPKKGLGLTLGLPTIHLT